MEDSPPLPSDLKPLQNSQESGAITQGAAAAGNPQPGNSSASSRYETVIDRRRATETTPNRDVDSSITNAPPSTPTQIDRSKTWKLAYVLIPTSEKSKTGVGEATQEEHQTHDQSSNNEVSQYHETACGVQGCLHIPRLETQVSWRFNTLILIIHRLHMPVSTRANSLTLQGVDEDGRVKSKGSGVKSPRRGCSEQREELLTTECFSAR